MVTLDARLWQYLTLVAPLVAERNHDCIDR
jgi:hypothetical protein